MKKCGSKQTKFERSLICNEKFTILNKENNISVRIEKDKNKKVFRTASQNVDRGNFLDIACYLRCFAPICCPSFVATCSETRFLRSRFGTGFFVSGTAPGILQSLKSEEFKKVLECVGGRIATN